ncbi:MAG: hypothetical protein VX278_16515 [Myxococcota bacterium]|nr:hypothetical protein [Myxococcota bacterium]
MLYGKKEYKRIVLGGATRDGSQLDALHTKTCLEDIQKELKRQEPQTICLWSGEPTLRSDLPQLISEFSSGGHRVWIRSDGLSLCSPATLSFLVKKGLKGIVLIVPGFDSHLYDWFMGVSGGVKKLLRTIKTAHALNVPLVVEIPLLRPNIDLLIPTIELLHQLKIRDVLLRRITPQGNSGKNFIALSPRLRLMATTLGRTLSRAHQLGVRTKVEGIPPCFFPTWSDRELKPNWLIHTATSTRCESDCRLPMDYIHRFGSSEFDCLQVKKQSKYVLTLEPNVSTREIRLSLSQIAAENPEKLILNGDFSRPDVYEILREALRLSVPYIVLRGDIRSLLTMSPNRRIRLRKLILEVEVLGLNSKEHDSNGGQWNEMSQFLDGFHSVSLFYRDRTFSFPCFDFPKTNLQ